MGFMPEQWYLKYPNNEAMCSGLYSMLELLRKCSYGWGREPGGRGGNHPFTLQGGGQRPSTYY